MPNIKVTVPSSAWTKEEKSAITTGLTKSHAQVALDVWKGDISQYINVQVEEAAEGGYSIGGNVIA